MAIKPGISVSAILISLRPQSAKPMSAMTQSVLTGVFKRAFMVCSKLKFETTSHQATQLKNRAHPAEMWMSVVAM
jgi:hypothetical protein